MNLVLTVLLKLVVLLLGRQSDMEKKPRDWYIQMQQYITNYIGEISFALNDKVQEIDVAYEAGDKISSQINNLNN